MKIAIAYYSKSGNCKIVAEKICDILKNAGQTAETFEIKLAKEFSKIGIFNYFLEGKSSYKQEKPELAPMDFNPEQFDCIILGTPVWASDMASPMRTFISNNLDTLRSKSVSAFMCLAGKDASQELEKMRQSIGIKKFASSVSLTNPKKNNTPVTNRKIQEFCEKTILKDF